VADEVELARVRSRLPGLVPESLITRVNVERPARDLVDGMLALEEMTSGVSDVLDRLGVHGTIGAGALRPLLDGRRICGPAITLRYVPEAEDPVQLIARAQRPHLGDRDLYSIGEPGDVAIIVASGAEAAVLGSMSARWAQRCGIAGAVVDGAARDVASVRAIGMPVWCRTATPVSGRHRVRAAELNGTVALAGVLVKPGDLVLADETGVCVVPAHMAANVLDLARALADGERALADAMQDNRPVAEIAVSLRAEI
jgi:4-hydroxy-4-methyl-2-oxoglutarate aldolase